MPKAKLTKNKSATGNASRLANARTLAAETSMQLAPAIAFPMDMDIVFLMLVSFRFGVCCFAISRLRLCLCLSLFLFRLLSAMAFNDLPRHLTSF